jgi:hypothetical protein
MTAAERLYGWNRWYDGLAQEWRFQLVLWPLIAFGVCNMLLSLSIRFPFGLRAARRAGRGRGPGSLQPRLDHVSSGLALR